MRIPLEWIDRDETQPRKTFDEEEMRGLISSMREHGQIQAGLVEEKPDGRFRLVSGERRLRALQEAGAKAFTATVRSPGNDGRRLVWQLVENIQRAELPPLEEASALKRLNTEFGMTHAQIAGWLGRSEARVGEIIRIADLGPEHRQAMASSGRRVSTSQLLEVVKAPERKREFLLRALIDAGASVKALRKARKTRGSVLKGTVSPSRHVFKTSSGLKVVVSGSLATRPAAVADPVLSALQEACKLRKAQGSEH